MNEKGRILNFLNSKQGETTVEEIVRNHLSKDSKVSNPATEILARLCTSEKKRKLVMDSIVHVANNKCFF